MKQLSKIILFLAVSILITSGFQLVITGEARAQDIQAQSSTALITSSPLAVVTEFQDAMIKTMKLAPTRTVRQRYERLKPTIIRLFHLPLMVQIVTGDYWSTATHHERESLSLAFTHMSASTIATILDEYKDETFNQLAQMPGPQNTSLVTSSLVRPGRRTILFTYVVRLIDGKWKIIDAIIDNKISELKMRRSEYNKTLKTYGIPGLILILNNKANELLMPINDIQKKS